MSRNKKGPKTNLNVFLIVLKTISLGNGNPKAQDKVKNLVFLKMKLKSGPEFFNQDKSCLNKELNNGLKTFFLICLKYSRIVSWTKVTVHFRQKGLGGLALKSVNFIFGQRNNSILPLLDQEEPDKQEKIRWLL